jgi:CHAD domain-containing protein
MSGRNTQKGAFVVPGNMTTEQVLQTITSSYTLSENRLQKINEHFYDTFDWRLYKKNYLLKGSGKTFYLSTTDGQPVLHGPGSGRKSFFSRDLEEGELRNVIEPAANIRALLLICDIKTIRRNFFIRNKDKKTVLRLYIDDGLVTGNGLEGYLPQVVYVEEVRGYGKAFVKVNRMLENNGLQKLEKDNSLFMLALAAIKKRPLDYSSKFSITIEKSSEVGKTIAAISFSLTAAMERNIGGVIEDIDSEFLHDFRIAIRRTRSLLSQMKKHLPSDTYTYFQDEFKWLGSITGPVRDLDVYLLKRDQYHSVLPGKLHPGLSQFYVDLERYRKNKFAALNKGLTSSRYEKLMTDWKHFLNNGAVDLDWPAKDKICYPLAMKMINKRFRRLIKDGSRISEQSPDDDLHRLRIQGKKLRYLLEFFHSFFNKEDIDFFLKHLRKLQNNLGDFNDISVQQEMLIVYQDELSGRNKRSIGIAAALGGLITHLAEEHTQIRQKFGNTFRRFASGKNIEQFEKILSLDKIKL